MSRTSILLSTLALASVATLAQAEAVTYLLDPNHTSVLFEIKHFGTSTNRGRFDKKEGSVTIDRAAKTGKVEVTFDIDSVNTGVAHLNASIKGGNLMKAAEFPTAKFVGDRFTFDGEKVASVAGTLTMLGKTQPVTLIASHFNCFDHPQVKREVCGGDFEATIQRSQWGMSYGVPAASDAVRLLIQVEGVRQ